MDYTQLDFDTWMEIGLQRGFVGPPVCYTHDGLPTTKAEDNVFSAGEIDDICIHIIRPYRDMAEREAVEENHTPTISRNPFRTAT